VAVLIAISVLAILTVIVMALAYSTGMARNDESRGARQLRASHLARAGLDYAVARIEAARGNAAGVDGLNLALQEGLCRIAAKPTTASDAVYSDSFLKFRPGDAMVTVRAAAGKGANSYEAVQTYLVNAGPGQPRRVLLKQETGSAPAADKR
jgi:hypothetical protein